MRIAVYLLVKTFTVKTCKHSPTMGGFKFRFRRTMHNKVLKRVSTENACAYIDTEFKSKIISQSKSIMYITFYGSH